jgi:chemotaxis regulatin CheY-phosphate phosphatase CheZ
MDKRVVKRTENFDASYIERLAEDYKKSKEFLADIEKRTNAIKKELSDVVDANGVPDEKGNVWLRIGDLALKREKRITRSLDHQSAEDWARANGHWDDIKQVIEVLDEDKLLALAWDNSDLEDTIQGFYVEKEVWAFKA